MGWLYKEGSVVPKDDKQAVAFYQRACDAGDTRGCIFLAHMHRDGRGLTKDDKQAVALYQRACDAGDTRGCSFLADMYSDGRGLTKDNKRAVELLQRACEAGDASGCNKLAFMYYRGAGVKKNQQRVLGLWQLACEMGEGAGCSNLAGFYSRGWLWWDMSKFVSGESKDSALASKLYRRAVELYQLGCESGDALNCRSLGDMYREGSGVNKDPNRAAQLFGQACDLGLADACDAFKKLKVQP